MNKDDMDAVDILCREILRYIDRALKEKTKSDITYKSVIKGITSKGYVVLDREGNERTAKCSIPELQLRPMQNVWVKEPMGNLRDMHIVGVVGK